MELFIMAIEPLIGGLILTILHRPLIRLSIEPLIGGLIQALVSFFLSVANSIEPLIGGLIQSANLIFHANSFY